MPDTLDLTPHGASGVCLLKRHGTLFITYLFISVRQATFAGDRCSQSKANSTRNHNQYKNCSFYFSAEKYATQCYWKHSLPRNVEIHPSSSTGLLPKLRYSHFHLQKISGIQGINLKVLKQTLQSLFFIADNPAYSLQLFKCHSICEVC